MASLSPSPTTVSRRRSNAPSKKVLNPSFADLPSSLLETIMSHLVLRDNIRASAACKSWREACVYVRVSEKHPWLMCFPKRGTLIQLRDPLRWKLYTLNLPELADSNVCYSKYGWLLMHEARSNDVFFFNPFSRELISLPKCELAFGDIAFSCPPTSDDCVLLALKFVKGEQRVTINTCHPKATQWITEDFRTFDEGTYYMLSNLVYCKDRFYCLSAGGMLYNFHPSSRTWNYTFTRKFQRSYYFPKQLSVWNGKAVALAEKKGELFVFIFCSEIPKVYQLFSLEWEEMTRARFNGLTIFFSSYNSEVRNNLPWMSNNVYFSRFGYNRKHCVAYSFDEGKYNTPRELRSLVELCPRQSIWIDPPKNVLDIL